MTDEQNDAIAAALADAAGGAVQVGDDKIAVVSTFAQKQLTLQAKVANLEEELKLAQAELKQVSERDLPNALLDMQCRGYTLADGSKIAVKKIYTANIKADDKAEAFKWLEDTGNASLIKAELSVAFSKGDLDLAKKLLDVLTKNPTIKKLGVTPELEQSVHWQTLRAFVREQLEAEAQARAEGEAIETPLPQELFGVYIIDKAEITPPK